ncbi:MAG: 3-oxoacyl-[acyl-carrier-protein] reductase [Actinobacteria bacterium]|nr:3-oxoacyl-[acyl-carrier-protein] reductase [Actinomycetota bacterium]MCG2817774.1 3-oxoacyl-[acyl-carrier-protein] reductase [Actinomycetes bacterium]MBU4218374.1 3-oxoacyl-[acyl-carrier-protein] reductase [Actinomycetota bacterium]MBU4359641.1 3-oxoacyl-[acyl-carrier-protein] reductase [Actinomycetota bacterium]MBU4391898.1 3-oxoacyl-[acyl-carrier-protein] reductase [Actinomycetota bacterium]
MKLEGKSALITGASRGIGREIALLFAEEGADVAVNYRSRDDAAREVAEMIEGMGRKALLCRADVSDSEDVRSMARSIVDGLGGVDILVNNAGVVQDGLLSRMSTDSWNRVVEVNLTGAFNCIKAVLPVMMRRRWGRIINMTSVVGQVGNPGQANYSAAKAGLIGLTRTVAREYSSRNILVNAISPGFIDTDMTGGSDRLDRIEAMIPLGRMGTRREVAQAALFLVSDATYTTGTVLNVSGGLVM